MDLVKTCSKCGEVKPVTEFYKQASERDGLKCQCKSCMNIATAKYREANAEKRRAARKAVYDANPEKHRAIVKKYRDARPENVRAQQKTHKSAYDKALREANPEEYRARVKAERDANPERCRATAAAYYQANSEKVRASVNAYREANLEIIRERKKEYYESNREKIYTKGRAWVAAHPELNTAYQKAYRARNIANLGDPYIKALLTRYTPIKEVPQYLIDMHREKVSTLRDVKRIIEALKEIQND